MKTLNTFEGGHPFSTTDLKWINQMIQDSVATLTSFFLPKVTDAAIISGCVLDGSGTAITISDGEPGDWTTRIAGKVIYEGKIYEVESGEVTGTFTTPYDAEVGLKIVNRSLSGDYPDVVYADSNVRTVYQEQVMELVTSGWDLPLANLSYASNTAQAGTIVGFVPPSGTALSDFVDTVTGAGKGRWRGWEWLTPTNGRTLVGYNPDDADFNGVGDIGGVKTVTLTAAQSGLPEHHHTYTKTTSAGGNGGLSGIDAHLDYNSDNTSGVSGGAQGAAEAHTNLQPYYVVVYMIKL